VSRVIGAGVSVPLRESALFPTGVKEALAMCARRESCAALSRIGHNSWTPAPAVR
jgi:hypothetical protein